VLGFIGFQKSYQLPATESGLFLSSGIPRWMPLEMKRVLSLDRCQAFGSLVNVFGWLPIDGFEALQQYSPDKKTDVLLPASGTCATQRI
jgi:hypothetical protein